MSTVGFSPQIIESVISGFFPMRKGILSAEETVALVKYNANFNGSLSLYLKQFPMSGNIGALIESYVFQDKCNDKNDIVNFLLENDLLSEFPAFQLTYLDGLYLFELLLSACCLKSFQAKKVIRLPEFDRVLAFCRSEDLSKISDSEVIQRLSDATVQGMAGSVLDREKLERDIVRNYQAYLKLDDLFSILGQYAIKKHD